MSLRGVEASLEWKLRAAVVPAAIVVVAACHASPLGRYLQRTYFSMIVHELGHTVTGWLCGFAALPGLWKTAVPENRSVVFSLGVSALLTFVFVRGWVSRRSSLTVVALALAVLQFVGTLGISASRAHEAIVFGGDGGAMVLGTLLMLMFFVGPDSALRTQHLRWGFLVIGAAALIDTLAMWWAARSDTDVIPFGEIEGVGLSDPSALDEVYGWTTQQLVHRYVTVGVACFAVLGAAWIYATWSARRARAA